MLEEYDRIGAENLIKQIECHVELPKEWRDDYFLEKGVKPTVDDNRRRFVRHALRGKAVLRVAQCLPSVTRVPKYYGVYTFDLSRTGISFLHVEELFPGERCQLWLPTTTVHATVARCRFYNPRCYLIGARFDETEE